MWRTNHWLVAESRLISISWRLFPLVSITFFCTKITATTQKKPKIAFRSTEPSCSSILRNSSPTKKFITCCCVKLIIVSTLNPFPKKQSIHKSHTQWTARQTANAVARRRPGHISDRRILGTGPAPVANDNTNLHFHRRVHQYTLSSIIVDMSQRNLQ